jgi:hypothetical protein
MDQFWEAWEEKEKVEITKEKTAEEWQGRGVGIIDFVR